MRTYAEHPYGLNWFSKEANLAFVNIPKCASSTIKYILKERGFKLTNTVQKGIPAVAVIREPYSRYISGLLQYWRRNLKKEVSLEEWVSGIKEVEIFDEHTEKQILFLIPFLIKLKWIVPMEKIDLLKWVGIEVGDVHNNKSEDDLIEVVKESLPFSKENVLDFYTEDNFLYKTWL